MSYKHLFRRTGSTGGEQSYC